VITVTKEILALFAHITKVSTSIKNLLRLLKKSYEGLIDLHPSNIV